eukprot:160541-Chlamydomonas_euryale.AAC.3
MARSKFTCLRQQGLLSGYPHHTMGTCAPTPWITYPSHPPPPISKLSASLPYVALTSPPWQPTLKSAMSPMSSPAPRCATTISFFNGPSPAAVGAEKVVAYEYERAHAQHAYKLK